MTQERQTGDGDSRPPDTEAEEGVGPVRPIRPAGDDAPDSPPQAGEHVGPAHPIDPARRQPSPPRPEDPEGAPPPAGPPAGRDFEAQPRRRVPARPPGSPRTASRRTRSASAMGAVDRVRQADFPVVLRGYDRATVDAYVADVAQLVAELEATQLPETVVQRALDEVGDETSSILKRAHEAGEEITSRSRSQAESRLHLAEREAELTRKEAEDRVRRLEDDVQNVWQERQRLIEDIRTLADDVLALADDAGDRLPAPHVNEADEGSSTSAGDSDDAESENLGGPRPLAGPVGAAPDPGPEGSEGEAEERDAGPLSDGPADQTLSMRRFDDEDTDGRSPGS